MTFTTEQLIGRRNHIGASEAAAVLGLSPFQTPSEIYYEKIDNSDPIDEPTPAMLSGIRLESAIVSYAGDVLGREIKRDCGTIIDPDNLVLSATPDGEVVGTEELELVEAKFCGIDADDWGDEHTDQIPKHYILQCQHQMAVTGASRVHVPVCIGIYRGLDWRMYLVERNQGLIDNMVRQELDWWHNHVIAGVPPTDDAPPEDFLKRIDRQELSCIHLNSDSMAIVDEFEKLKADEKAAVEATKECRRRVLTLLGTEDPAEIGLLEDGRSITFKIQNSQERCDKERLRMDHPEIYREYYSRGRHRVLRIGKAKCRADSLTRSLPNFVRGKRARYMFHSTILLTKESRKS